MKPVNLMPTGGRRAGGGGSPASGAAYVVLGGLVAMLAAVALLVHTQNGATERQNRAADLDETSSRLEAQAKSTSKQVPIALVRQQRTELVRGLALGRLDWERLVLETARVMPAKTWLSGLEASAAGGDGAAGGSAPAAGAAKGGAAGQAPAAPSVALSGCAPDHERVADLLVRLRGIHGAQDVELIESGSAEAGAPGSSGGGSSAGGTAASTGCAKISFKVRVALAPPAAQAATARVEDRVPVSLGGGQ